MSTQPAGSQGVPQFAVINGVLNWSLDGVTWNAASSGVTVQTASPVSGDGSSGNKITIADGAVALSRLATQAQATVVGVAAGGGTVSPSALTQAQLTALVNLTTTALPGALSTSLFALLPAFGANIGDADTTVNPGTDKASAYLIPAGVLTANRNITAGLGGSPPTDTILDIVIEPQTHSVIIKDDTSATLFTVAASSVTVTARVFLTGGHFIANTLRYCNT